MTNWYSVFYWLSVADNVKTFLVVFVIFFTIVSIIATICYIFNGESHEKEAQIMSRKWMWWSVPLMILFWAAYIFTPSKKDALIIIAGGAVGNFVTQDSSARKIPAEVMNLLRVKIAEEVNETSIKEAIGIKTDTLKNKSKEELIKLIEEKK